MWLWRCTDVLGTCKNDILGGPTSLCLGIHIIFFIIISPIFWFYKTCLFCSVIDVMVKMDGVSIYLWLAAMIESAHVVSLVMCTYFIHYLPLGWWHEYAWCRSEVRFVLALSCLLVVLSLPSLFLTLKPN